MTWQTLESKLSTPRMARYLQHHRGNEQAAAQAYIHNMRIAESLVSIFHVLEVSLRNAIQKELAIEYDRPDWYEIWEASSKPGLKKLYASVTEAKRVLRQRRVNITPDNIVAELSFGF